jgi:hypothetical protein
MEICKPKEKLDTFNNLINAEIRKVHSMYIFILGK